AGTRRAAPRSRAPDLRRRSAEVGLRPRAAIQDHPGLRRRRPPGRKGADTGRGVGTSSEIVSADGVYTVFPVYPVFPVYCQRSIVRDWEDREDCEDWVDCG